MNNNLFLRLMTIITLVAGSQSCNVHALSEAAVNALSVAGAAAGAGAGYFGAFATKKFAHNAAPLRRMGMNRFVDNHPTAFNNKLWAGVGAAVAGVATRVLLHQFTPSGRYNKANAIYDAYSSLVFTSKKLSMHQERNAEIYADAGYVSKPGQSYLIQAHVDLGYAGQDLKFAQELLTKARQDANGDLIKKIDVLTIKIRQAKEVVMYNIMCIESHPQFPSAYRIYLAERNAISQEKVADATVTYAKIGISREVRGWLDFLGHFNIRRMFDNLLAPIRMLIN